MENTIKSDKEDYKNLLKHYIETQDEQSLYGAEQISKAFIKNKVLPEEIVSLHIQALTELYPDLSAELKTSMNFLLETMISYGLAHQEYQTLRKKQHELKSEIEVAAGMQETLLSTNQPDIDGLDIGAISVPAHQMNGDYHHFIKTADGSLGVAIADIVGKGVPAALCMSMIKYAMDTLPEERLGPQTILEKLNRVVERNVDSSMFITMFYAQFLPEESKLVFSSAGHEPGFFYRRKNDHFEEMETKGLVLGVSPDTVYNRYEAQIENGDMVILLTDGVTECRKDGRFIESREVLDVIRSYSHLPAQEMVDNVFKYFERMQDFQLRDDFTLIVMQKRLESENGG